MSGSNGSGTQPAGNLPPTHYAATIDVSGEASSSADWLLGSGDVHSLGFGDLVTIEGTLTLLAPGTIDGSTGIASAIQGSGVLVNDGEIISIGGKGIASGVANSLLTIGGGPASGLSFRNDGLVVAGENITDRGQPGGSGTVIIAAALDPASTGRFLIETRGTLDIASDPNRGATYDFEPGDDLGPYAGPSGGVLIIDNSGTSFDDAVVNFASGETVQTGLFAGLTYSTGTIVLRGIGPVGNAELDTATHVLRVYADGGTADQIYAFTDFDAGGSSGDGMVNLTGLVIGTEQMACFAAGTMIATPGGEVAIEHLRPGDPIRTVTAGTQPIRWIGRRRISLSVGWLADRACPVCVLAHAFGEGLPRRDVLLSGDHAVFADGVLVPVRLLINGATVVLAGEQREVTYFHIELPTHQIVLADGLPVESWLDTGNRATFDNAAQIFAAVDPPRLPGGAAPTPTYATHGCAPLVESGPRIGALRERLFSIAGSLGVPLRTQIEVRAEQPGRLRVAIPAHPAAVRLTSASARQAGPDVRRLGALIRALRLDGTALPFAGVHLERGFHPPERHGSQIVCWTDGDAVIAVPGRARHGLLEIDIATMMAGTRRLG